MPLCMPSSWSPDCVLHWHSELTGHIWLTAEKGPVQAPLCLEGTRLTRLVPGKTLVTGITGQHPVTLHCCIISRLGCVTGRRVVRVTVPLTKASVCGDFRCQQGLSILGSDAWLEPEVFNGYLLRVVVNPASPGSRDKGKRLGLSWYLEMRGGGGDGSAGGGCKCQYSGLAENKAHRTQPPSVLSVCNPRDPTLGPGACDLHGRLFSSI